MALDHRGCASAQLAGSDLSPELHWLTGRPHPTAHRRITQRAPIHGAFSNPFNFVSALRTGTIKN
jgi:hypothetical protein